MKNLRDNVIRMDGVEITCQNCRKNINAKVMLTITQ
jgi:hypothetical protein